MRTLHELAPWCVIVPMVDNAFNRCRSNLPILEATSAGAVALGKNLPEYVEAGAWHYDTPTAFGNALRGAMDCFSEAISPLVTAARELQQPYDLETCNAQRWGILEELGFPAVIPLGSRPVAAAAGGAVGG
jgi:hypothetical protein